MPQFLPDHGVTTRTQQVVLFVLLAFAVPMELHLDATHACRSKSPHRFCRSRWPYAGPRSRATVSIRVRAILDRFFGLRVELDHEHLAAVVGEFQRTGVQILFVLFEPVSLRSSADNKLRLGDQVIIVLILVRMLLQRKRRVLTSIARTEARARRRSNRASSASIRT